MKDNIIIENYASDKKLISEFHNFISKVFPSISFKEWYMKGFWPNYYIPFSLINSGEIISNVCVAEMTLLLNGEKINAIQIGAVGTLPQYRNQGLSRILMDYVLDRYINNTELFFLFANETVMEFYPKFGFKNVKESIFLLDSYISNKNTACRKLNIKNRDDNNILLELINNRKNISNRFGVENYGSITMWHVLNLYLDDLYYLEEEEIILIKREKNNILHIFDVIFRKPFDFGNVVPKIIESDLIKSVKYYFSPDQLNYRYNKTVHDDSGLFIRGEFDLENKNFKYPETAHT